MNATFSHDARAEENGTIWCLLARTYYTDLLQKKYVKVERKYGETCDIQVWKYPTILNLPHFLRVFRFDNDWNYRAIQLLQLRPFVFASTFVRLFLCTTLVHRWSSSNSKRNFQHFSMKFIEIGRKVTWYTYSLPTVIKRRSVAYTTHLYVYLIAILL